VLISGRIYFAKFVTGGGAYANAPVDISRYMPKDVVLGKSFSGSSSRLGGAIGTEFNDACDCGGRWSKSPTDFETTGSWFQPELAEYRSRQEAL
jgi:hypothetical protein